MSTAPAPRLYTTAEVAQLMGLSRQRVSHLIADGRLVPTRRNPLLFTLMAIRDASRAIGTPGNPNWGSPAIAGG